MGFKKKTGKGRLDKYYRLAKDQGYRARSAFKLIQLNKKYDFLSSARCLIDLCAAPGGWLQVAAKYMPMESLIVGVDLAPIKALPNCITFQEDITTPKCRAQLREHLKTWKADVVLHDGAPNVGTSWVQDAFSQSELVLESLRLAVEFLNKGGVFVTKVFRSKDYNNLLWVFNQLFSKVEATKPPSSRNVSAEIFVVCQDFLAPKKIDPKFLDIKYVFKELDADMESGKVSSSVNIFKPDKKKQRHRDGYADGANILFVAQEASEFMFHEDPVAFLSSINKLTFESEESKKIFEMPCTTAEIKQLVEDLKLIGKADFRNLLKWRRAVQDILKPKEAPSENVVVEVEQESLESELARLADEERLKNKKVKRKVLEKRQKEMIRLQLKMTAPMDIGTEGVSGISPFVVANNEGTTKVLKASMDQEIYISDSDEELVEDGEDESDCSDDELKRLKELESGVDYLYSRYKHKKQTRKERLQAHVEKYEDWNGFDDKKNSDSDSDEPRSKNMAASDSDSNSDSDVPDDEDVGPLSGRAAMFFDQPLFRDIDLDEEPKKATKSKPQKRKAKEVEIVSEDDFEAPEVQPEESDSDEHEDPRVIQEREARSNALKLKTPEAMTLAIKLANKEITKSELISSSFNRYAFGEENGLPEWFRDNEKEHSKPNIPVTKEAIQALKQQQRDLDARPIKKVAEAKARKKFKTAQKLAKMKKKASSIAESEDMSEREKAKTITKIMSKSKSVKDRQVKLVVARGSNKRTAGRPAGVKGRYKMVDARMKKELRATKRIAKKTAKKRR